jgi:hypothetical protein
MLRSKGKVIPEMNELASSEWLSGPLDVGSGVRRRVSEAYECLAEREIPVDYHSWVEQEFGWDLSSEHAGRRIENPWAKASGQLSMTVRQVSEDVAAGLGYVVLKTLIAESEDGGRSMSEWATRESRMQVEPIVSGGGQSGWTVSWRGRGWSGTFVEYLELVRESRAVSEGTSTLVIPSVKYHLPEPGETRWLESEYEFTTAGLLQAWGVDADSGPMPLEKDFSPTLAGSERSRVRETVLEWIRRVPGLIRGSVGPGAVSVGLKIFNTLEEESFQFELLRSVQEAVGANAADWWVYGNRLFDPDREFEGIRGIAYGGWDLSDRNLRVLSKCHAEYGESMGRFAATGNICSGRMALEYALRGAASFQLHTMFQLPSHHYVLRSGSRTQKALHELYLHPDDGLVVWLAHLADRFSLPGDGLRFRDLVGRGRPG